jgi:hypothetical protein
MIASYDVHKGPPEELLAELERVGFPREAMLEAFASMREAVEYTAEQEKRKQAEAETSS